MCCVSPSLGLMKIQRGSGGRRRRSGREEAPSTSGEGYSGSVRSFRRIEGRYTFKGTVRARVTGAVPSLEANCFRSFVFVWLFLLVLWVDGGAEVISIIDGEERELAVRFQICRENVPIFLRVSKTFSFCVYSFSSFFGFEYRVIACYSLIIKC